MEVSEDGERINFLHSLLGDAKIPVHVSYAILEEVLLEQVRQRLCHTDFQARLVERHSTKLHITGGVDHDILR